MDDREWLKPLSSSAGSCNSLPSVLHLVGQVIASLLEGLDERSQNPRRHRSPKRCSKLMDPSVAHMGGLGCSAPPWEVPPCACRSQTQHCPRRANWPMLDLRTALHWCCIGGLVPNVFTKIRYWYLAISPICSIISTVCYSVIISKSRWLHNHSIPCLHPWRSRCMGRMDWSHPKWTSSQWRWQ